MRWRMQAAGGGITDLHEVFAFPKQSMYGIFTHIYYKNQPNVGKYTIHGWYGFDILKQKWHGSMSMSYFICPESILLMDLLAARLGLSYSLMVSHHSAVICLLLCVLSMSMLSHSFVFVFQVMFYFLPLDSSPSKTYQLVGRFVWYFC